MRGLIWSVALTAAAAACGSDCLGGPCPLPIVIQLSVTASGGTAVSGLVVQVTDDGAIVPCLSSGPTSCFVSGYGGSYRLDVSAPGFQSIQKTVQVAGPDPKDCGCYIPTTANVAVTLVPASTTGTT